MRKIFKSVWDIYSSLNEPQKKNLTKFLIAAIYLKYYEPFRTRQVCEYGSIYEVNEIKLVS